MSLTLWFLSVNDSDGLSPEDGRGMSIKRKGREKDRKKREVSLRKSVWCHFEKFASTTFGPFCYLMVVCLEA